MLEYLQRYPQQASLILLNSMFEAIGETLVLDHSLQTVVDLLHEIFKVSRCLIFCPDVIGVMRIGWVSQATADRETLLDLRCDIFDYYQPLLSYGQAIACSQTEIILPLNLRKVAEKYQVRSFLIVPFVYQHSYLGGIDLQHCQHEHQWTEAELAIVQNLARQCALTLYQTQQLETTFPPQPNKIFSQINRLLNSCLEPEQVLTHSLKLIGETFQLEQVILVHLDKAQIQVCQEWRANPEIPSLIATQSPLWEWEELLICQYQFCHVFKQANDQDLNSSFKLTFKQACLIVCVAIFIREKFFGYLILQTTPPTRLFTAAEIETLELVSEQIAIALYNAQSQERLEQLVKQRTQALETEKQHIETANLNKNEFLSHMSHELRTPLTGILGFARMLRDEIYGTLNNRQKKYVNAIATSGDHLLALINDFLDISKIEADREELFWETVPVEEICLASLSILQARAKEESLELRLEIEPDVDFCPCDQRRLKQILVNLLSNAIKFTEVGSVTLKVKRNQNMLEFSVIDTGIGIKQADQKKLFQPFQQINNHLSRKYKGTGLGLALSRKLARLHGGELTLTSEEGQGSCFTVHLPVIRD